MTFNPFEHGNPVPPERYIQRRAAQATVVSRLVNYGQSSAITGEPRTGKTSLLLYLAAPEKRVQLYEDLAERLIFSPLMDVHKLPSSYGPAQFWARALRPLYVRFGVAQSTANHTAPAADLSPHLLSRLCAALEKCRTFRDDAALRPLFVDRRISPWRGGLPDAADCAGRVIAVIDYLLPQINISGENALVLFLRVLADRTSPEDAAHSEFCVLADAIEAETRAAVAPIPPAVHASIAPCLESLTQQAFDPFALEDLFAALKTEGWRFVLLLDEYDCLQEKPHLNTPDFYGALRSVTTLSRGALCLLLAGRTPLEQFHTATRAMNTGSPYFNFTAEVKLGAFEAMESDALLSRCDRFTPEDRRRLVALTGGHPHRLQIAAAALWDAYDDAACWQHVEAALKTEDQGLGTRD